MVGAAIGTLTGRFITWICLAGLLSAAAAAQQPAAVLLNDLAPDRVQGARVQFSERWFDQTCFGQLTEKMARRRCNELLDARIKLATTTAALDQEQRSKLLTAALADIHRYFDDYNEFKRQYEFGDVSLNQWQTLVTDVYERSAPYRSRIIDGLNGPGSLYDKALSSYVDADSAAAIRAAYADQARERYISAINETLDHANQTETERLVTPDSIPQIELRVLGILLRIDLSAAPPPEPTTVRQQIVEILTNRTDPPEFYGNSRNYMSVVASRMMDADIDLEDVVNRNVLTPIELYRLQAVLERNALIDKLRANNVIGLDPAASVEDFQPPDPTEKRSLRGFQ